jgi:hypothetical protein
MNGEDLKSQVPTAVAADAQLEHVVDDLTVKEQWADWIHAELATGRTAEQIAADMVDQGWDSDEAAELVETVRKLTRAERGVVTREEVARANYKSYRSSTSRLPFVAFGIDLGLVVAAMNLIRSVLGLRALSRLFRRRSRSAE